MSPTNPKTNVTLANVREELLNKYDCDELVDVLNISSEELLDRFRDKFVEYARENDEGDFTNEGDDDAEYERNIEDFDEDHYEDTNE